MPIESPLCYSSGSPCNSVFDHLNLSPCASSVKEINLTLFTAQIPLLPKSILMSFLASQTQSLLFLFLFSSCFRSDVLAGGLSGQEMTLAVLLEQAFRIKEEVAAGLQSARGSLQMEAMSCRLLENHILTVTRIVKHLSKDIQALEGRITEWDLITSGTTKAIQELDQKNTAGIGDLRGRVARCDASIAKLSADGNSGEWQLNRLQHEVAGVKSAVDGRLKELKAKVRGVD
uniref:Family with sequence similarity 81 member B n=1 Tax=Labrus bergylta TaxID=56723 RepID=A0A3Q3FV60_9LABR